MDTYIGTTDPQTVKKWAKYGIGVATAVSKEAFFASRMTGSGEEAMYPIQSLDHLEEGPGDEINVTLLMPASMEPVVGEETLEGKGEAARWFVDKLRIEMVRQAGALGGTMTQKRTYSDIRKSQMTRAKNWWKRACDELHFIHLSGSRGTENKFLWSATNPFFTYNVLNAPDSMHQMYGGVATSRATITNASGMKLRLVDRCVAKAETMGGDGSDELSMVKCSVDGSEHYVLLMHTFQFDEMKQDNSAGGWLDIQRAHVTAAGAKAPIFQGAMGMFNDVLLYKHRDVIGFRDGGVGADLPVRRALFMGAQAGIVAYGSKDGQSKYKWTEAIRDHGEKVEIGTQAIMGIKKSRYTSKDGLVTRDFGVIAVDTYAANPNA